MNDESEPSGAAGSRGPTSPTAAVAVLGFAVALFGVYWDDVWHTDRGRDEFLSAPHLALYAGIALAVGVTAWWGWRLRSKGWVAVLSGPIGLAIVGAAVTLGSAPLDEWWHQAFGRDAVLWSPPHLLALTGTIALGSGVLLVAAETLAAEAQRFGPALLVAAGVGVMGAWQVLVLEYDSDIAQFSELWYLPVLALGSSAAALTVQAAVGSRLRWSAAWTGASYTFAMAIVIVLLKLMGFSAAIVPAVFPALLVADVSRHRGWAVSARSTAFVAALFLVYVPYLRIVPGGVAPSGVEIVAGLALAVPAVSLVILILDPEGWPSRKAIRSTMAPVAVIIAALLVVSGQRPAAAHDPGQGEEIVDIQLVAEVTDRRVNVTATFAESVPAIEPSRLVARRAGRVVEGTLIAANDSWVGEIELDDDGRWFVYVEGMSEGKQLEAWLPVVVGGDGVESKNTALYLPAGEAGVTRTQAVIGGIVLFLAAAIVARVASSVRSTQRSLAVEHR